MKNHFAQGKASKLRILLILLLLVSLSFLTLSACNKVDVASISVVEDTVPQNVKVSDFDITKVAITVTDSQGNESQIYASSVMLTTDSREKLKEGGEGITINLMYKQKMTSFTVTIFDDNAELVTVTFKDTSGNIIKEIVTIKGGRVTPPTHPVLNGKVADGWVDSNNAAVTLSAIQDSIEVTARYVQNIPIHTVTFKDFNNQTIDTIEVAHGNRIPGAVSYTPPSGSGIETMQWMVGNTPLNTETFIVNNDVIVSMRVEYVTHTVVFQYKNKNNEMIELTSEPVDHNGDAIKANAAKAKLALDGYNFIRWKNSYSNVTMDLTVEAEVAIFSYTVTFKDYNGAILDSGSVNHGDSAAPPASIPTKTGHDFLGEWSGGSLTNITSDMVFVAQYTPKSITLTFFDGASSEIIEKSYGDVITSDNLAELKQKPGNILLGIYSDAALSDVLELPYEVTAPDTIYSKWVDTINGNSELTYSDPDINNKRTVTGYTGSDAIIYIPDKFGGADVTGIDGGIFSGKNVEKVFFGANIKTIGANAFEGTKLSGALQLPSALETIGAGAFADCLFLTSVSIPASVTGIGSSAFFMNEKLAAVTFAAGNALDTIGADVFLGCAALSSITLPASVTTIASGAFTGAGLTSIDLADRVSTIGEHAFAGCENLTAVTGTAALTDIQRLAFASTALVEINLPAVVTIGERAFENNDALTTVALGSTLSALEPLVFANCSALTSVNFSTAIADETVQGITEINNYAFLDCDNLRNIVFPETLSTISALAFENAHKLQSIEVSSENTTLTSVDGVLFSKDMTALIVYPAGKVSEEYTIAEDVTTIKTSAFSGAIIANLTVASTVATLEDDAFNSMSVSVIDFLGAAPNVDKNPLNASLWRLYVATEHLDSFIALSQFAAAQVKPAEYVTSSLYDEVSGLSYVINNGKILIVAADRQKTSITVPASIGGLTVTAIKEYAFANCNNLESVQIDANLLLLGESAFANCTALNDISFASIQRAEAGNGAGSVININAFYDTPWYTSRNLITISDTAFAYKDTFDSEGAPVPVTSLEIPEGVAVLETGLFDNAAAASLTSITLPQSLEIIREGAFRNTNITGISIPNSVHTIGASAFENSKLVSISMNSSAVTDLSAAVFKDCAELQQITLPSSVKTIGAETFMGCVSLTKAVLSSSLVSIGASAFQGCSALPVLDLPARVGVGLTAGALALGNEAFADCDSLVYLRVWNATPATIGTDVFEPYVYIYVESSDGSIADAYRTQWSQYAAQIRDQKDSPVISFTANEDGEGEVIEAMKNLTVASRKAAVLYGDDMSAAFKDAYPGYIFVCWMYEATPSAWLPVEYPFRTSDSTILRARWVKTQEGSLTIDDLTYNSSLNGYVLNTYSGTETRLVIPSVFGEYPLVYIGENAFLGRDGITEIRFAADSNGQYNLKYIGAGAFSEMDGLTSLVLPSSVIDIAENAFAGCTNLESILIPQDVRSIGAYAFEGCAELNIEFAQNSQLRFAEINSFEDTAWYADSKADDQANFVIAGRLILEYLKQENQNLVTLPGNTIALRAQLFANDSDLVTVEFHQYIEFIGERAFYNCASLINVDFGSSDISKINEVGAEAFAGTAWLNQQDEFVLVGTVLVEYKGTKNPGAEKFIVQLPKYITIIDKNAFNSSALDQIIFTADSKLERIEEGAFAYCSNLEKIRIPAGVTFIGKNAFRENTTLQSVVFLGNAVKVIGDTAFYGCTGLGTDIEVPQLTLPSALNALGTGAFEGCSALTNVNLQNTSLTIIKSRTFFGDNNLSTVIIPDTLVTLEADAFAGCTVLENITTGGNSALKVIAAGALETTRWYNREIPEDEEDILIYIGNVLLKYRQKEGSSEKLGVVVPAQVKYIAAYAFINSNISSISLPSGLLEIGDYAFAGCSFLNTVTLPSSVTSIGIYSFSNCEKLETVELGSGLETIERYAFSGSYNLTRVTLARMGYGELTEEQEISVNIAIEEDNIGEWLDSNSNIFTGTQLINTNAFADTSTYLRLYVVRDSRNINIELYRYLWTGLDNKLFNSGDVPTVSFVNVPGASPLAPISTELLTEQNAYTVFKDNTLLGWEAVNSEDDPDGVPVTLPFKVIKDTTLRPVWLSNNRPVNDTFLGMTYAPNASGTAFVISSYNSPRDTLVIGFKVNGNPLSGVNSGVFTEANTANITTVIFTSSGSFSMLDANIFKAFANLEKFVVLGENANYVAIDGVLYSQNGNTVAAYPRARKLDGEFVKSYSIRAGVTNILAYAFSATKLESLEIPESVKTIGTGAFEKSFSVIPGDPTHFNGLKSIAFGAGSDMEYVAYGAFDETAWFKELSSAFKLAGSYLLSYNGYTDKVTIPSTVKTVGVMAFKNNDLNNITQLTIPASVRKINDDAFTSCSSIVTIIFDAGSLLMDIANDVFNDTSWIDAMNLETSEFIVAGNVLISYKGGRDYLPLPNEIKVIGYNAFNNAKFTGITLHNSLLRIDENAFYGCDNLASITIPASVTSIGKGAFYSCLELNTIAFAEGSTLKTIGESAFAYNSKLAGIVIPDTVEVIGKSAFEQCTYMSSASLNETSMLVNLGERAFMNARKLESVFIPDGLKEIKTSTFEYCQGLKTVNFSNNNRKLTTIGENAFKNCTVLGSVITDSLLTVQLPFNVTRILPGAFYDCSSMYGIKMQGQIVSIGLNAFYGCSALSNVTISTAQPPVIEAGSFNFYVHQNLRVYVNVSQGQSVLSSYATAWGGDKVAKSSNIFERGSHNFPLIQIYSITRQGEEQHITSKDFRAEFISAASLPSLQDEVEGRGMSTGYYKNKTDDSVLISAKEVVKDAVLKIYVKWENA